MYILLFCVLVDAAVAEAEKHHEKGRVIRLAQCRVKRRKDIRDSDARDKIDKIKEAQKRKEAMDEMKDHQMQSEEEVYIDLEDVLDKLYRENEAGPGEERFISEEDIINEPHHPTGDVFIENVLDDIEKRVSEMDMEGEKRPAKPLKELSRKATALFEKIEKLQKERRKLLAPEEK